MATDYLEELALASEWIKEVASAYMVADRFCESKETAVGVFDVVTDSDVKAEKQLIARISEKYPNDRFLSEETRNCEFTDERTWIIDPIDGTMNFTRGIPIFGTQLCLAVGKEPVLSVIYLPSSGELFTATSEGAFLNEKRLSVGSNRPLKQSIISLCDFSRRNQHYRDMLARLIDNMYDEVARIKVLGAACCDFVYLAKGSVDLHIRFVNNLWDFMPGLFLCRMAGAYVDEELMSEKGFLLIGVSKNLCDEFCEKVVKDLL